MSFTSETRIMCVRNLAIFLCFINSWINITQLSSARSPKKQRGWEDPLTTKWRKKNRQKHPIKFIITLSDRTEEIIKQPQRQIRGGNLDFHYIIHQSVNYRSSSSTDTSLMVHTHTYRHLAEAKKIVI